jgi:hypothetical protein
MMVLRLPTSLDLIHKDTVNTDLGKLVINPVVTAYPLPCIDPVVLLMIPVEPPSNLSPDDGPSLPPTFPTFPSKQLVVVVVVVVYWLPSLLVEFSASVMPLNLAPTPLND